MDISARGRLDEDMIRAVQGLALFGKAEPKKAYRRRNVLYIVLSVLLLLCTVLLWDEPFFPVACPICALLCLGGILLNWYTFCLMPRNAQKKSPLAKAENLYVFGEDALTVTTEGVEGYTSSETRPYSMFIKLAESTDLFFLYLDKIHIYPVEKASLSEEEICEIRRRLLANKNVRHVICRY